MATYTLATAQPWILRPASAFNPARAWLPCDNGSRFKEFIRGDDAALSGSYSWGTGSYGRALVTSGGSALTPGVLGSIPAGPMTITVAYFRTQGAAGTYADLVGWGDGFSGQYGFGHQPSNFGLSNFSGVAINQVALGLPTNAWRIVTVALGGNLSGSPVEYWADGIRIYVGTLGADFPAPTRFRIGASNNGNLAYQGAIGPVYAHPRALSATEIRLLHADIWRLLRDYNSPTARLMRMLPPPFLFGGSASLPAPAIAGELGFRLGFSGTDSLPAPAIAGEVGFRLGLSGAGLLSAPAIAGELGFRWPFSATGVLAAPTIAGELNWFPPPPPRYDPLLLGPDLTDEIEIQEERIARDDRKAIVRKWVTVAVGVPASVQPRGERSVPPSHRREGMGAWYRIYLLPDPVGDGRRITTAHRIRFRGRLLRVRIARDIAELGEVLTIDAEEGG